MRYFLLFLMFFFMNCASFATNEVKEVSVPFLVKMKEKAIAYSNAFEEATRVERGLLTGERGLTPFVETDFASFRVISCKGGIPKNNKLFLMIESKIKEGWQLKKPDIPSVGESNSFVLKEDILYPINKKAVKKTDFYEEKAYFSFLYEVKREATTFEFEKEISFTGCKGDVCQTETIPFFMKLDRNYALQTDVCPMMIHEFQNVPMIPVEGELSAKLSQIDENYILLMLDFHRDISSLGIQIEEDFDWQVVKKDFRGNKAHVLISSSNKIEFDNLNIKLFSSLGSFDLKLPLSKEGYTPLKRELSYFGVFKAGFCLFFFTPLFLIFLQLSDKKKQLKQQVKVVGVSVFSIGFVFAIWGYFSSFLNEIFELWGVLSVVSLVAILYALINPKIKYMWLGVLFFVWPKTYVLDTLYALDTHSFLFFVVFAIWAFMCYLPFKVFKNIPRFFKEIRKVKQYPFLIRIPQVVMLCWLIFTVGISFFLPTKSISDFENLREQNKTMFVSLENGYCLSCQLNKLKLLYIQKTTSLIKNENLEILTVNTRTSNGNTFLKKHHLHKESYGLVYGEKLPYPVIVYGSIPLEGWQKYFSEVTEISEVNKHFISSKDGEH